MQHHLKARLTHIATALPGLSSPEVKRGKIASYENVFDPKGIILSQKAELHIFSG